MVEVTGHGRFPGSGDNGKFLTTPQMQAQTVGRIAGGTYNTVQDVGLNGPVYFIEDSEFHEAFVSIPRNLGVRQRDQLELLNTTLLKCKEHGMTWEVNVLDRRDQRG